MASDPIGATRELRSRRSRRLPWLVLGFAATALCYALPPVRFVRISEQKHAPRSFATTRPAEVWDGRLMKSLDQAVDAKELLAAIRADRAAAAKKHARRLGVGGAYYYFVGGSGRVASKERSRLGIAIDAGATQPDIVITTGNIFGNAVRDGTGLFNVNDYANSKDFNDLSAELNQLVETRVLPALRDKAAVGSEVRFTGVAEVEDEDNDLHPLRIVPVAAEVK